LYEHFSGWNLIERPLRAAKIVIQPAGTQSRSGRFTPCIFKANDFAILIVFCSRKPWALPYSDKE
jgi:hypothetical protein